MSADANKNTRGGRGAKQDHGLSAARAGRAKNKHTKAKRAIAGSIACDHAGITDILLSPPNHAPSSFARAFSDKILGTFDLLPWRRRRQRRRRRRQQRRRSRAPRSSSVG